jgi:pSer/pThr/pTyr-binding forkhead associated (FHA) protein
VTRGCPERAWATIIKMRAVARLVEIHHGVSGQAHVLSLASVTLGRNSGCDIVIDQAAVSRRHARISWGAGGYRISDLGSMNGTYVDGKPVAECALADGTEIHVGEVTFRFVVPAAGGDEQGGDESPPAVVTAIA